MHVVRGKLCEKLSSQSLLDQEYVDTELNYQLNNASTVGDNHTSVPHQPAAIYTYCSKSDKAIYYCLLYLSANYH